MGMEARSQASLEVKEVGYHIQRLCSSLFLQDPLEQLCHNGSNVLSVEVILMGAQVWQNMWQSG